MLSRQQQLKLGLSAVFFSVAVIYIAINTLLPTSYFRDIFFYADAFVAHRILETAYIPITPNHPHLNYWGKIGNRVKLPILPLLLVITRLIAGVTVPSMYTLIPAFLVSTGGLYILSTRTGLKLLPASLLSVAGGLAMSATAFYAIAAPGLGRGLVFLAVGILVIHLQREERSRSLVDQALFGGLLVLIMICTFYWYPPNFIKIAAILFITGILAQSRKRPFVLFLTLVVIAIQIGQLVIEIPLSSYMRYLQLALVKSATLSFSLPTGANSVSYSTAYSPHYYSLLPLIVLTIPALIGGILALREVMSKEPRPVTMVAVAWGSAVLVISAMYLATSTSWLIGRTYFLAFPVMILGVAIGLERVSIQGQTAVTASILIFALTALVLQAALPAAQIQSYEPGIQSGSQWTGDYLERAIVTDVKVGAPMAANGELDAMYPRDYDQMWKTFYTTNYSHFSESVNGPVLLSVGMTEYGLFALSTPHQPIPEPAYKERIRRSNRVYTNGEVTLLYPKTNQIRL